MAKNDEYNERYTEDRDEIFEGEAHPGRPLEPDELEPSPPEFQKETQAARSDESGPEREPHPTEELDSTPSHKASKSKPSHMTDELSVKPRRRR